jgi:hypothetical protein
MKKLFKTFLYITLAGTMMLGVAYAQTPTQNDYTVLAPLPGIGDSTGGQTSFNEYVPRAFTFMIGIAAALAFVMITLGGITYATTDSILKKEDGKKFITDAIWGLVLVIGAYAILNTINPNILSFKLNIPRPSVTPPPSSVTTAGSCTGCATLSSFSLPAKNGLSSAQVTTALGAELQNLNTGLQKDGISWYVSEAYPPTYALHKSDCHSNGSCVDANLSNPTAANINQFAVDAAKAGLNANYEVQTTQELQMWISAGVNKLYISLNASATAAHFHVQ